MKASNELIDNLQKEVDKLTPIKESYSKEDIKQLICDINQLQKEKLQLENAKLHNTISEDEAAVANGKLMIKQTFLGIVTTAALSYLRNELDKVTTGNAMLRANYLVTHHDTSTKN